MLRKFVVGNLLVCSLLTIGCGQSENSSSANVVNANSAMSNSNSPTPKPGSSNIVAPTPAMTHTDVERPVGTPVKAPSANANSNAPRKPRIEERKPPEREKP